MQIKGLIEGVRYPMCEGKNGKVSVRSKGQSVLLVMLLCVSLPLFAQDCPSIHTYEVRDITLQPPVVTDTYQACGCVVSSVTHNSISCVQNLKVEETETIKVDSTIAMGLGLQESFTETVSVNSDISTISALTPVPVTTITFSPSVRTVKSIDVLSEKSGIVNISDDQGQAASKAVVSGATSTLTANWTKPSRTIAVMFTTNDGKGWPIATSNLVYQ